MLEMLFLCSFVIKVQVYKAPIKSQPDFFSSNITVTSLGQKLNADTIIAGWYRVKYNGKIGYIHNSAARRFNPHQIKIQIKKREGKNDDAISLAAKGFIEDSAKSTSSYDFQGVKYLERFNVNTKDIRDFRKGGGL